MDKKKELRDQTRFSDPFLKILADCLHLLKTYVVYEVLLYLYLPGELCYTLIYRLLETIPMVTGNLIASENSVLRWWRLLTTGECLYVSHSC